MRVDKKISFVGVKGRVKWYSVRYHYGFIARDDGKGNDVFVHQACLCVRKETANFSEFLQLKIWMCHAVFVCVLIISDCDFIVEYFQATEIYIFIYEKLIQVSVLDSYCKIADH